jgi:hypothetical protein
MIEGTQFDTLLHVITLIVAVALFIVSISSYRKKGNKKFLYVCSAFGIFALKEVMITASIAGIQIPGSTGLTHILNLVILALFFRGTIR